MKITMTALVVSICIFAGTYANAQVVPSPEYQEYLMNIGAAIRKNKQEQKKQKLEKEKQIKQNPVASLMSAVKNNDAGLLKESISLNSYDTKTYIDTIGQSSNERIKWDLYTAARMDIINKAPRKTIRESSSITVQATSGGYIAYTPAVYEVTIGETAVQVTGNDTESLIPLAEKFLNKQLALNNISVPTEPESYPVLKRTLRDGIKSPLR
jgi:hypothetical protein